MIEYREGDALDIPPGKKVVVAHVVNDLGVFGAGFAKALADKWPHVRTHYLANHLWYSLGEVLFRDAEADGSVVVANLFAQEGLPSKDNRYPLKYDALRLALEELTECLSETPEPYEVWMPRIGTGFGGGQWGLIEKLICDTLVSAGVPVVVFTLPKGQK